MNNKLLHHILRFILIVIAALIMSFNINNFIHIGGLLPGGFTGITLLLQKLFKTYFDLSIPFTAISLPLNAIPAIISYKYIGKNFTLYSCLMIFLTSIFADLLPSFQITDDILLCAIFGGLINALSICICLLSGATSGGTDFISIFISERFGKDAWNYILLLNIVILSISGLIYGLTNAMYSIILQFVSTQVIGTLYKRYQRQTLLIITTKPQQIYEVIQTTTHHDCTLFKGTGLYLGKERQMIYSVISSDESRKLVPLIKHIDQHAFINVLKSEQIMGNFYKRPND